MFCLVFGEQHKIKYLKMDYSKLLKICCQDNKLENKNIELIVKKSLDISFDEFKLVVENYIHHNYPNFESKINLLIDTRIRIQEKSNCIINKQYNSLDITTFYYEELIQVLELFDEKELLDIEVLNFQKGCSLKIINGLHKVPKVSNYWTSNGIFESFELPVGNYLGELNLSNSHIKRLPDNFVNKINNFKIKTDSIFNSMSLFLDGNPLIDDDLLWENNIKIYDIFKKIPKDSKKEDAEEYIYFRIKTNNTYPINKTKLKFDEITENGIGIIYHPKSTKSLKYVQNIIPKTIVTNKNTNSWNWKLYLFWFAILYLIVKWLSN